MAETEFNMIILEGTLTGRIDWFLERSNCRFSVSVRNTIPEKTTEYEIASEPGDMTQQIKKEMKAGRGVKIVGSMVNSHDESYIQASHIDFAPYC